MSDIVSGVVQAVNLIVTLNPDVMQIALLSIYISLTSTILAACIAIPIGGFIHFYEFRGKKVLIALIQTLYSLPTVVVGLLIYLMISRSGPLGFFGLLYTPQGMILGQTILIIPMMTGLAIAALSGVGRDIRDTLVSLGATGFQSIVQIVKEARVAILSAVILGFGRAISEVGVAMMIGGNIRNETRVLTTAIALQTGLGDFGFSIALGIILLSIALVIVILMYVITSGVVGQGRTDCRRCATGIIECVGLSRVAGGRTLLDGIDLTIKKGEIFTLIGPSGSGKTTLIRLIDLLDRPSAGRLVFDGTDTNAAESVRIMHSGAGWVWSSRSPLCSIRPCPKTWRSA